MAGNGGWQQRDRPARHREKLLQELHLDKLRVGDSIPKNIVAGCVLGISDKMAGEYLRKLLAELDITWEETFVNGVRTRVVVEAPNEQGWLFG
jgi:hypothetical protein